jgi:capsular exopolysaccharide synthesis family protein
VGFILNLVTKPRYRSTTRIVLEGKSETPMTQNADNPLADLFLQDQGHTIATQIGVIQGEEVLSEVSTAAHVQPDSFETSVTPVVGTELVDIAIESGNQSTATKVAALLPDVYRKFTKANESKEIFDAKALAVSQEIGAKEELAVLRRRLRALREASGIFSIEDYLKYGTEGVADAQSSVSGAEANVDQAQAQLDMLVKQRDAMKPLTETPTEISNPDIPIIQSQIASLKTDEAGLLVLYTHDSPKVEALDMEIKDLEDRLAKTPKTVTTVSRHPNDEISDYDKRINDTKVELAGAQAGLTASTEHGADASSSLISFADKAQNQEEVEEDVERCKAKRLDLIKTEEDLDLRAAAVRSVVTMVTPSHTAAKVSPKQAQNLIFAAVLGLVLGVCFALLQEYLDDRVNSPDHVKALISAPTLGFIPLVKHDSEVLISSSTASALMESYRALRSNVGFATVDSDTNAILITSTRPGEGKSTTAVNLASSMALDDKRVILVDLDLRRPTIHQKLHLDPGCGVTNVLMGHKTLEEALQPTQIPGLEVLTSGPLPPNPAELMNTQAMRRLLEELKHRADVVIIDSPPLLATADSQVLSALVDGVVYVIQFGVVRKPEIRHAYSLLQQASINMLGVVFNKIDVATNREYGYGVYQHYNHYSDKKTNDADSSPISSTAFNRMIAQIDPARRSDDLPAQRSNDSTQNGSQAKPKNEKRP